MSIFKEIKTSFIFCGLGTEQFAQIAGRNVPRSFIRFYIILFSTLVCAWEAVLGFKYLSFSVVDSLSSFVCLLGFFPVITIYISLIVKTKEINNLFSYLEEVINTSNGVQFDGF